MEHGSPNKLNRRSFLVQLSAAALTARAQTSIAQPMSSPLKNMLLEKFRIDIPQATLTDLQHRLSQTRWNDAVTDDWEYGMQRDCLSKLVTHWLYDYDWRTREKNLNELPHFRAVIDGFGVHFLHFKGRNPSSTPLLLMNGWPSSFVEYQKLVPLLTDPARFGGDPADAFNVVIPALPGFGFSDRPTRPRQVRAVDLFFRLMTQVLGYKRFAAAGTDIGAGVATRLANEHPEQVIGIHITAVADPPSLPDPASLQPAEKEYQKRAEQWAEEEGAYEAVQSTRPQTLAFGLDDSPIGLASWIVEKFYFWSDCHHDLFSVFPLDMLIDNLMVYWVTETIGSSVRYYYESRRWPRPFKPTDRINVPTAVLMLPHDLVLAPREWAERFYNVQRYNLFTSGGHFPAWEVPELYAKDLREFFRVTAKV